MVNNKKTYDVFISYGPSDKELALEFAEAFRINGLEAFTGAELAGENMSDALWEALAESAALVAILTRAEPSPSMGVEIGAAQAWSKPIYAIVPDPSSVRLPSSLSHLRLFTSGGIEDVIRDIKQSSDAVTDEDRQVLREVYEEIGTPVDSLALDHQQLRKATDQFNKRSGRKITGERLLSEMLRMRKRGDLPNILTKSKPTSRRHPA